jgi:hypothetical protein
MRDAHILQACLDGKAFEQLTQPYRRELQMHCYGCLGSEPSVAQQRDIGRATLPSG